MPKCDIISLETVDKASNLCGGFGAAVPQYSTHNGAASCISRMRPYRLCCKTQSCASLMPGMSQIQTILSISPDAASMLCSDGNREDSSSRSNKMNRGNKGTRNSLLFLGRHTRCIPLFVLVQAPLHCVFPLICIVVLSYYLQDEH